MAKKYERQATNKYYGVGSAGKVYTNTESDGLAKALANSSIKFGNAISIKQDLKKDKAIAKINEMYASGKKFEDINSEILKGLHPELTGSYIDATTNYHKGRVLATEVMREIEANKNKYDINDTSQSLENFYKPYMPEFDGMDKSTILGFSTMFNNYKSKDALIDADNRSKNATRIKIDEGVSILDTIPTVNIKELLAGEFNALKTPVPASDGSGKINQLYTNKEAISVLVRSVDKVISLAETEADLDRADAILSANLGVGKDGQAIASLGSRNSKEVLKLKEDLLKKRRALIINDRTNANQKEKEDVSALFASIYEQVPVSATAEMKGAETGMRDKNHVELMEIREEFEKIGVASYITNFDRLVSGNAYIDTDPAVFNELVASIYENAFTDQDEISEAFVALNLDPKLLSGVLTLFNSWDNRSNKNGSIHVSEVVYKEGLKYIESAVRGNYMSGGILKENGNKAIRNAHNYMKTELYKFETRFLEENGKEPTTFEREKFMEDMGNIVIKKFVEGTGGNPAMKTMTEYEDEIRLEKEAKEAKDTLYQQTGVTEATEDIAQTLDDKRLDIPVLVKEALEKFDSNIFGFGFGLNDENYGKSESEDRQAFANEKLPAIVADIFKDVRMTEEMFDAMTPEDFNSLKEMLAKEIGAGVNANVYGKVTTQIIDQAIQLIIKNQKGN